jgi:fimbrial chaperone protein
MLSRTFKSLCAALLISLAAQSAWANLLINPTRVQFNANDRTADITLINTSNFTTTYRLEWLEKKAKINGGYFDLTAAEAASFPMSSNMIRFSPKQVTLKAGERQVVKLAIRRPQNLAAGEYRSHLQFKALPPKTPEEGFNPNSASTAVNIVLNFAIPVVVQQGTLQYDVAAANARISYNPSQKNGSVDVDLTRSGTHSVIGTLNAYWTPNGGRETLIAKAGDYNFWPELNATTVSLAWVGADFAITDGKLRIVYEGVKDFRGKVFFDKTFSVNGGSIKTLN